MFRPTAIERAFELAKTGRYATISDLREAVLDEGLDPSQLQGRTLHLQLRQICADAKKADEN
jgi:hypothetical protein